MGAKRTFCVNLHSSSHPKTAEDSRDVYDDEDWSKESEFTNSDTDSASEGAGSCNFGSCSGKDDSACNSRSRKQCSERIFQPMPVYAASEDLAQDSRENLAPLSTQDTEFYVLSP